MEQTFEIKELELIYCGLMSFGTTCFWFQENNSSKDYYMLPDDFDKMLLKGVSISSAKVKGIFKVFTNSNFIEY